MQAQADDEEANERGLCWEERGEHGCPGLSSYQRQRWGREAGSQRRSDGRGDDDGLYSGAREEYPEEERGAARGLWVLCAPPSLMTRVMPETTSVPVVM